jgi:hypothetical protein
MQQLYFAKNLDKTSHYTVTSECELQGIMWYARCQKVPIHEYIPERNYIDCSGFLTVYNCSETSCNTTAVLQQNVLDYMKDLGFVDECPRHLSAVCKLRNIKSESLGFMEVNGAGWNVPYPFLNNFSENKKLVRPGISGRIATPLRLSTGVLLQRVCALMAHVFRTASTAIYRRWKECAKVFWYTMVVDGSKSRLCNDCDPCDMVYEGTTVIQTALVERLEIHVDTLNSDTEGYTIVGVVNTWSNNEQGNKPARTGVIAYSRQCCGSWLNRLTATETNVYYSGMELFNALKWVRQRTYRQLGPPS